MTLLLLGLALFLGVHSTRIVADGWRTATIARVGEKPWKAIYSLLSIAGFVLLVIGYGAARQSPVVLYTPPVWTKHLASLLTIPSFVLLVAAYVPGNAIKRAIGHPMVAGVKLWALAHLLVNPEPSAVPIALAVLFLALVGAAAQDRKKQAQLGERWAEWLSRTSFIPFGRGLALPGWLALLGGSALFLLATWIHPMPVGVWQYL